jgi:hypothetical protein
MKIAFFSLLIAAKATQMRTTAAQEIFRAHNKVKSVRALIGENSDDDGINPFIVGGDTLNRTIWEQSLRYLVDIRRNGDGNHTCGATKISARVVLTAARELFHSVCCCVFEEKLTTLVHHSMLSISLSSLDCFTITEKGDPNFGDFRPRSEIQFNRYAQDNNDGVITIKLCQTEGSDECHRLAHVVRHPDYVGTADENGRQYQNDIALIILPKGGGQQVADIPIVALNCKPNVPLVGQNVEVVGWGRTSNSPNIVFSNEIKTATIKALTNSDCKDKMNSTALNITDDMLCAKQEGIEVAGGDSGTCNSSA